MATSFKVLGQAAPSADTDTNIYTVPSATQTVVSTIVVANRDDSESNYRIAIRPAGATIANQHFIAFDVAVGASDSLSLVLGITLDTTDVITVRSSSANLSFNIFGSEIF